MALGLGLRLSLSSSASSVPFLTTFSGASAAYSLRQLSAEDIAVVRVRRSSDDAEQDFSASEIDDGTLTTFTGVGNGFLSAWYDQVLPTSKSYIKPNEAANTYATATNATGVISGKKITFTYHRSNTPAASQGVFGVTDADGYRFDVYETGGDLRVFNRNTAITKSGYYDITPTTAFANGETYDIEITYGLDGEAPTNVWINGVAQTVPASPTSSVSPSATTSTWYLHTIGAGVGTATYKGVNGISNLKVYDTDETTLLHHWKLNNVGDGLIDQTNSEDFTVQNGNYTRNSIDDFDIVAKDAIQTTAANQPQIVASGTLVTENGKPAIDWASGDYFDTIGEPSYTGALSAWVTFTYGGPQERLLDNRGTGSIGTIQGWQMKSGQTSTSDLDIFDQGGNNYIQNRESETGAKSGQEIRSITTNGVILNSYRKGVQIGSTDNSGIGGSSAINFDTTNDLRIGSNLNGNNTQQFTGKMQEIILFNSYQDSKREDIEANINSYYGVY